MSFSTNRPFPEQLKAKLEEAVADEENLYCVGGEVVLEHRMILFYKKDEKHGLLRFPVEDTGAPSFQDFISVCGPAHFGIGEKTVIDPTVRSALRLNTETFGVNFDIPSRILETIKCALQLDDDKFLSTVRYALNVYGPDGHFSRHVDTPLGSTHVGSLVIALPSRFEGGEFFVRHENNTTRFCMQPSFPSTQERLALPWVAFFNDCEHRIEPVISGYRMTITYHLYVTEIGFTDQVASSIWKEVLNQDAISAIPRHIQYLGIGLSHSYPSKKNDPDSAPDSDTESIDSCDHGSMTDIATKVPVLKGSDARLAGILRGLNFEVQIKAAYLAKIEPVFARLTQATDVMSYDQEPMVIMLSDSFSGGGRRYPDERSIHRILKEDAGAERRRDVYWCRHPNQQFLASSYCHYGNEASVGYIYVAAALLVKIRPHAEPALPYDIVEMDAVSASRRWFKWDYDESLVIGSLKDFQEEEISSDCFQSTYTIRCRVLRRPGANGQQDIVAVVVPRSTPDTQLHHAAYAQFQKGQEPLQPVMVFRPTGSTEGPESGTESDHYECHRFHVRQNFADLSRAYDTSMNVMDCYTPNLSEAECQDIVKRRWCKVPKPFYD